MDLLLNICIYLPLAGIAAILFTSSKTAIKWISLIVTAATFCLSLPLLLNFDIAGSATVQYLTVGEPILSGLDVKYIVGLDGISLLLFLLTTLFGPIVIL